MGERLGEEQRGRRAARGRGGEGGGHGEERARMSAPAEGGFALIQETCPNLLFPPSPASAPPHQSLSALVMHVFPYILSSLPALAFRGLLGVGAAAPLTPLPAHITPLPPPLPVLAGDRQELERLHSERLMKLRAREEDQSDKLKRQQVSQMALQIHNGFSRVQGLCVIRLHKLPQKVMSLSMLR